MTAAEVEAGIKAAHQQLINRTSTQAERKQAAQRLAELHKQRHKAVIDDMEWRKGLKR